MQGGLCAGGSVKVGLCPGVSVQGVSVQGVFVWGISVQGISVQEGLCPEDLCPGGLCQGGSISGRPPGRRLPPVNRMTDASKKHYFAPNFETTNACEKSSDINYLHSAGISPFTSPAKHKYPIIIISPWLT